jgi:NifB/MoaA-like Fe-S oxidoreductase
LVREKIQELNQFREIMDKFKRERSDIFAGIEGKLASILEALLDSADPKEIELIPLEKRLKLAKEITTAISNLYEKERLERGESTENVVVIVAAIREAKKRMQGNIYAGDEGKEGGKE